MVRRDIRSKQNIEEKMALSVSDCSSDGKDISKWETPKPHLSSEWRKGQKFIVDDPDVYDDIVEEIRSFESATPLVPQPRILLVGSVGSGKSTYINSVASALQKKYTTVAKIGGATYGNETVTKRYKSYTIQTKDGQPLNFRLCDVMGVEQDKGLTLQDFENIMQGKIQDGQELSQHQPLAENILTKEEYKKRAQAVVFVVDANKTDIFTRSLVDKLREMRKKAKQLGVHSLLLLTHMDEAHNAYFSSWFNSIEVREFVNKAAKLLEFEEDEVLPVCNYGVYGDDDVDRNILILRTLIRILGVANLTLHDTLDEHENRNKEILRKSKLADEDLIQMDRLDDHNQKTILEEIESYKPPCAVKEIKIQLIGEIGVGKSSFINSVATVTEGKLRSPAEVESKDHSVTRKYREHTFTRNGKMLNLKICDCMGLEVELDRGLNEEDLPHLLNGRIKSHYTFNAGSSIEENSEFFISNPPLTDVPHVLAILIDCSRFKVMHPIMKQKLQKACKEAKKKDTRVAIILTKVDIVSEAVKQDVANAKRDKQINEIRELVAQTFPSVQRNAILFVKNYDDEQVLMPNINGFILLALQRLLGLADDTIKNRDENPKFKPKPRQVVYIHGQAYEVDQNTQKAVPISQMGGLAIHSPSARGNSTLGMRNTSMSSRANQNHHPQQKYSQMHDMYAPPSSGYNMGVPDMFTEASQPQYYHSETPNLDYYQYESAGASVDETVEYNNPDVFYERHDMHDMQYPGQSLYQEGQSYPVQAGGEYAGHQSEQMYEEQFVSYDSQYDSQQQEITTGSFPQQNQPIHHSHQFEQSPDFTTDSSMMSGDIHQPTQRGTMANQNFNSQVPRVPTRYPNTSQTPMRQQGFASQPGPAGPSARNLRPVQRPHAQQYHQMPNPQYQGPIHSSMRPQQNQRMGARHFSPQQHSGIAPQNFRMPEQSFGNFQSQFSHQTAGMSVQSQQNFQANQPPNLTTNTSENVENFETS